MHCDGDGGEDEEGDWIDCLNCCGEGTVSGCELLTDADGIPVDAERPA
jgi:hypothetical protein